MQVPAEGFTEVRYMNDSTPPSREKARCFSKRLVIVFVFFGFVGLVMSLVI
jgi:hypothetical protein